MVLFFSMSIEKIADMLLSQAVKKQATDIHIIPRHNGCHLQFRIDGKLFPYRKIPLEAGERLISHFKFMASMDISEKRKPQSGSLPYQTADKIASLRVSTLPTARFQESLVIRILALEENLSIEKAALFPQNAKKLMALCMYAHGLILFTGPTGSGKSSTMYSLVESCSTSLNRNVITLEDPVEKQNDYFLQVQVNEKAGVTYSAGLKAILRHDPDIILVGEIRDAETAKIAIQASLTGHLVISTLHTRDAKGAIYRLMELGVKWHEIEQTLVAVTAQRLVTLLCPFCGEHCSPYCYFKLRHKRAAVYELLQGKALQQVLLEANGKHSIYRYQTLKDWLRKGLALGYISKTEYNRWVFKQQEKEADIETARDIP